MDDPKSQYPKPDPEAFTEAFSRGKYSSVQISVGPCPLEIIGANQSFFPYTYTHPFGLLRILSFSIIYFTLISEKASVD
jgi:hypothetical protein